MPSLVYTLRRWYWTVRALMNMRGAMFGFGQTVAGHTRDLGREFLFVSPTLTGANCHDEPVDELAVLLARDRPPSVVVDTDVRRSAPRIACTLSSIDA
jgi:hypothetical protein